MTDQPHPASFASAGDDTGTALRPATIDTARHDGWTPARQAAFLRELAATHNVSAAAKAVGMGRQSAYKLRARLRGMPFDRAWEAAFASRFDVLAEAALERALNGVEVPHYYNGELIGTSRKYDERLTLAMLATRNSFRPSTPYSGDPTAAFEPDEFAALIERVESGPEEWLDTSDDEFGARFGWEEEDDDAEEEGAGLPSEVSSDWAEE